MDIIQINISINPQLQTNDLIDPLKFLLFKNCMTMEAKKT